MDQDAQSVVAGAGPSTDGTPEETPRRHSLTAHKTGGLGELASTAICGNDITSSCLYVSALAILYAGKWAPVSLLIVVGVLYLFRSIYGEVVGALPLNGGAYNALLNTTSKFRASIAATLTILSYMATAVISANEAMHYVGELLTGFPVIAATIAVLAVFMILTILGITESSRVAIAIFFTHIVALTLLLVVGIGYVVINGTGTLSLNFGTPTEGSLVTALFFGFAASMLGISGFESSANFVEEQAEGVFPKTLRNMWIAVAVFNPGMALLALALVPIGDVGSHQEALLAHMGRMSGGTWLSTLISIDAALVLSGAVLTSFVGVNGLVKRMTLDRCLPQFLLRENRRGTTHNIVVAFFVLAVSVLLITGGELRALAGVYTISFLAVMVLFGVGNVLLKVKRAGLPRPVRSPWTGVIVGIAAVVLGLAGNAVMNPPYLRVFLNYFIPAMAVIVIMLGRISILKAALFVIREISKFISQLMGRVDRDIESRIDQINSQQLVFFTHFDDIANLNKVLLYIRENEHSNRLKVVSVVKSPQEVPEHFRENLDFIDRAYPDIDIEFVLQEGEFGPDMIQSLSEKWGIPTNLMFIGSPGDHFMYGLADLGGVRLII